jgi:hypothetical protein
MRWQLRGDWPVGQWCIPADTIIDGHNPINPFDRTPLPMPPPFATAVALDDEAALAMCMAHEEHDTIGGWHHLHFAPGIDREAIFAQARHKKRWPNGVPQTTSGAPPPERKKRAKGA